MLELLVFSLAIRKRLNQRHADAEY
jgi:hypothetical protein